ncbi:MAG: phosphoesterase, partial [Candidatus Dormibacteraeota bacterium]|nr:phosphoesterase [Candidatus Dormibacteraeota bacterium]
VADGDSDQVSVIDTTTDQVTATIPLSPYSHANVGTNPTGLALSSDRRTLYVADSGNNDVDVVDLGGNRVAGSIPVGWYPSAVASNGSQLFVANAKGLGAGPNDGPGYPNPAIDGTGGINPAEYDGSMIVGTLSTVGIPLPSNALARDTAQVAANDGFHQSRSDPAVAQPIQHVIYVVRENRTFDQEFGSLGKGNGDPQLNLFGDDSAPNSRALERNFVTLDNFYADAEVSAQGWNWDVAANSDPYSEDLWPANYSPRNGPYPSESGDPAIAPNVTQSSSYIWDRLATSGISFRNYGFYVSPNSANQETAADPVLNANTDHAYRGFDLNCPDAPNTFAPQSTSCGSPRISEWLREFQSYVAGGNLPTVSFVRLPNDHTSGTAPGKPSAKEYVADNDLALGMLVQAVSHSQYWKNTGIFVTEDDAQNGPDHIDAHRTTSEVISPYTQTGTVDSTFYSTVSMLRTIEDIVGIQPLTQFDEYATPMSGSFTDKPNLTPYTAVRPADAGGTLQTSAAPMSAISAQQNPLIADQLDSGLLNEAIWKSIKGANSKMPAPVHATTTQTGAGDGGGDG